MQTIAFQCIRKGPMYKHLNSAQLKILLERFQKHSYITHWESVDMAERLHINPEKIQHWFQHQRKLHKAESERKNFLRMLNLRMLLTVRNTSVIFPFCSYDLV